MASAKATTAAILLPITNTLPLRSSSRQRHARDPNTTRATTTKPQRAIVGRMAASKTRPMTQTRSNRPVPSTAAQPRSARLANRVRKVRVLLIQSRCCRLIVSRSGQYRRNNGGRRSRGCFGRKHHDNSSNDRNYDNAGEKPLPPPRESKPMLRLYPVTHRPRYAACLHPLQQNLASVLGTDPHASDHVLTSSLSETDAWLCACCVPMASLVF